MKLGDNKNKTIALSIFERKILILFIYVGSVFLCLKISIDKTKVMYKPAPGEPQLEPVILVYGKPLEVVRDFVYLGSSVSYDRNLDA